MKLKRLCITQLLLCFCILGHTVFSQTTTFTYQGSLRSGGSPATGNFDFEFKLFDLASAGAQQGSTLQRLNVPVANGIFTVSLDFGAPVLPGADRFLDIAVRTSGGGAFTPLTPRQQVSSAPYAVRSLNAAIADSVSAGGIPAGSGNYIQNGTSQQVSSNFNISGDGTAGGMLSGNIVSAGTEFQSGGARILAANLATANTFVGVGAGVSNTTGDQNTFVGRGTGPGNLTGNNNTFVGAAAGNGNKGSNNTAVGRFSGLSITTGSNNTLIGANSNVSSPTLSYAAAIGADAVVGTNNTIVMGRSGGQDTVLVPGMISGRGAVPWQVVSGLSQQAQPNNGYITTNDAQVTVTLPTNPNIGDIVRVSSTGTGGWKIAQNAGQSMFTTSVGGFKPIWTPHENIRSWYSVASSADGTKLAAVNGANGLIYTSTDSGINWTPRDSNRSWQTIASSSDGNKLVAGGVGIQIYTSTDSGVTWTPRENVRNWTSIASSADGSKLVAVDGGLSCVPMPCEPLGRIYTSTDSGVTWTPRESDKNWGAVASSADGTKLVAGVYNGRIYTSTDSGVTWTDTGTGGLVTALASSSDGSKLAACKESAPLITSSDSGVSWTQRPEVTNCMSVASSADGTRLVVAANRIYTSFDSGVTWTAQEVTINWFAAASSADGGKLVVAAMSNRIYTTGNELMTTAGTAGYLTGGQFSAIELQYVGNGRFLPLSSTGTIFGN